ncbi:alpha/beta hydrolase family esterase [Microbacterium sp.]|uniref:alpha/beta hydrolase family esterase n=1 Tax=Microbacterium sp. TaxID=51671 RepID=UPI003A896F24
MSRPHTPRRALRTGFTVAAAMALALVGAVVSAPSAAEATPMRPSDRGCVRTLPVGTSTMAVSFGSQSYDVIVHVPKAPKRKSLPLVVDLHGSNANGGMQAQISDLAAIADKERFITVNPTGAIAFEHTLPGGNWAWNVPGVPLTSGTYPPEGSRDDVAFLRAVVEQVDAAGCVNDRRVYATGFSGGGRMASALACEASDVFAAIAPVAGLRAGTPNVEDLTGPVPGSCDPEYPVAVATFHGDADFVNPYLGNEDPRWGYTVMTAAEEWADLNGCRVGPRQSQYSDEVTALAWKGCDKRADVVLYEVAGGGHTWPGTSVDLSFLGYTTQEISASQAMWDFFSAHPRIGALPRNH